VRQNLAATLSGQFVLLPPAAFRPRSHHCSCDASDNIDNFSDSIVNKGRIVALARAALASPFASASTMGRAMDRNLRRVELLDA
jgi:hypothetical protein